MRGRPRVLATGILLLLLATAPAAAQPPDGATVFPVTRGAGDGPDGHTLYQDLAVHPDDDRTMIVGVGVNDLVVHRNVTMEAYDFDLRNYYFGAAWHPSGEWGLVASHDIAGDAASGHSRFGRGGGDLWRWEDGVFRRVHGGNVTLQSVAFAPDGAALVVGTALRRPAPGAEPVVTNAVLHAPDGRSFRPLDVPTDAALRDVAWRPDGEAALIAGAGGTVLRFADGGLTDVSLDGDQFVDDVEWRADGATLTGATATEAFLPAGNGTVLRWRDGDVRRIAATEAPLRDLAWRPDGASALAVGDAPSGDGGAAYILDGTGNVSRLGLDAARLRAAAWLDRDDALLAGDREIWRYTRSLDPRSLPATAALTVTPRRAAPNATVRLDAWGSTYRGSADRVTAWQFSLPGETTGWRASPRFEPRFATEGERAVAVRARGDDGTVSPWRNRTVVVDDDHTHSAVTHRHEDGSSNGSVPGDDAPSPSSTTVAVVLATIATVAGVALYRRRR